MNQGLTLVLPKAFLSEETGPPAGRLTVVPYDGFLRRLPFTRGPSSLLHEDRGFRFLVCLLGFGYLS
jgi:hypothetical protein